MRISVFHLLDTPIQYIRIYFCIHHPTSPPIIQQSKQQFSSNCIQQGSKWLLGMVFVLGLCSITNLYGQNGEPAQFTDISAGLTGVVYGSVAWGDYDNDGDLDILLTGNTWDATRIARVYRNDNGSFTDISVGLAGVNFSSVAWGDYDNDGDLDILLTGITGSAEISLISRIYRNDGGGSFTEISTGLVGVAYSSVAWGDYDNDGDLDILLTGDTQEGRYVSQVYRNDGGGSFTYISTDLLGVRYSSAAWGDYDNDGDLDILLTGRTSATTIAGIYRNDGPSTIGWQFTWIPTGAGSLSGVEMSSVAWGDYDNDGDLDILLAGYETWSRTRITRVYRNDGPINDIAWAFPESSVDLVGVEWGSVVWGDYDNDGDLDILVTGSETSIVYRNDGGESFTNISTDLLGVEYSSVAWGDYDRDGDLDILLTGRFGEGYTSSIYMNNCSFVNNAPATPVGLVTSMVDDSVTLSWSSAIDPETPSAGLTYNLRIGTTPGGHQIMSAHGDSMGYRYIPAIGNVNHDTSWIIHGIPDGAYYWSVQAIDAGFVGSVFATEKVFNVTVPPDAPTNLIAIPGDQQVILTWSASAETDLASYYLYKHTARDSMLASPIDTLPQADTSTTDIDLTNGTTYWYWLSAVDSAGNESGFSNEVSATPSDQTAPAAPQNLMAEAGDGQVTLIWAKSTEIDFLRYRIYGDTTANPATAIDSTESILDTTRTIFDLDNGTTCYFRITAVDTAGNESGFSNEVSVTPSDQTAPAAPQNLMAEAGDGQVTLIWAKSTESDFLRYHIYGDTTANPATAIDSTESVLDTTRTISELNNGTAYYFRVTAVDTALNESDFSNEVSATPAALAIEESSGIPTSFALHPTYPNPFNPSSTIRFDLPESVDISIVVYDLMGREISRLVYGHVESGYHQVMWNGRDSVGREVPTGIYIARLVTPEFTKSIKMVLLK